MRSTSAIDAALLELGSRVAYRLGERRGDVKISLRKIYIWASFGVIMIARKKYLLTIFTALAIAAFVAAAVTFTNVTYWLVNATLPPVMKYAGSDVGIANGSYVKVSYYYDPNTSYNITRISVIGFTGDPTNYTDVIRVCNYYGPTPVTAKLVYVGQVSGNYSSYVKAFYVYWTNPYMQPGAGFVGATTYSQSAAVTLNPGQCASAGVYLLIDPNLPSSARNGKTVLATYQVNVQMQTS